MNRKFTIILILFFIPVYQYSFSQSKKIDSKADIPPYSFPTNNLKTGDSLLINDWINKTAEKELKLLNNIFANYTITNWRLNFELIRERAFCNFITSHWKELADSQNAAKDIVQLPAPYRKGGLADLSSYAKSKLQFSSLPEAEFDKGFIKIFENSISRLNEEEKETYIGNIISITGKSENLFYKELNKISGLKSVSDTSLFPLLEGYIYKRFYPGIHDLLEEYIMNMISESFNKADSIRGTLTPERAWWNVLRYDITVKPDYESKTITGINDLQYQVLEDNHPLSMQIDLQEPLQIDSINLNSSGLLSFNKNGNAWYVAVPEQEKLSVNSLLIYYHGKPTEAKLPPWDGGWVWSKDSLGNPWMSAACQGIGASVWYPCKDHQSDEPDKGASLTMIVQDGLVGVSNGRMKSKQDNSDGTVSYKWEVINPINNYDIIPYIGKYVDISDQYSGENGMLDIDLWVLEYNVGRAKNHILPEVKRMLKAFEYWMGPYPFYEDSYKLIDAPYAGMEHQSAIAYGNRYLNGFWGFDRSGSGWGLKWDYMIVHESGHEWFGNNITTNDIADMWVHEGFADFSETLFTDYWYGSEAGNEYNKGLRKTIENKFPIIGFYGVNKESISSDMYSKGSNLLNTIRHSIDDNEKFRNILRELTKTFYHSTVNTGQIENFISENSGFDYGKVFDQYLRTIQIPSFEFYFTNNKKTINYRYSDCLPEFDLPLTLSNENSKIKIFPSAGWQTKDITADEEGLFNVSAIEDMYYINAREISK